MESAKSAALPRSILQLKGRLLGISPMIWRRVLVPDSMTLRELHEVVQLARGWEGIHLFEFVVRGVRYAGPDLSGASTAEPLSHFRFREPLVPFCRLRKSSPARRVPMCMESSQASSARVGIWRRLAPLPLSTVLVRSPKVAPVSSRTIRPSRVRSEIKYLFDAHWSPNHSAHIKQSHRVHYRWHPFHGLDVRELRRERHASGEFVRVEADPGEVALIAAWMLDPVACARLDSGEPLVSLSALVELHYFLIESGFRKHSRQDMSRSREDTDENPSPDTTAVE